MKKHLLVVLAILFLSVATLNAQSVHLEATILFDFVVGKTTLHAGKYSLTPTGVGGSTLLLRSSDLKEAILITPCVCESGAEQEVSTLVFRSYGKQYYLWQVWSQGYNVGREFPIPRGVLESKVVPQRSVVVLASLRGVR